MTPGVQHSCCQAQIGGEVLGKRPPSYRCVNRRRRHYVDVFSVAGLSVQVGADGKNRGAHDVDIRLEPARNLGKLYPRCGCRWQREIDRERG